MVDGAQRRVGGGVEVECEEVKEEEDEGSAIVVVGRVVFMVFGGWEIA